MTVKKLSENDIYTNLKGFNIINTESNFTVTAEIITKFYLELQKNYKDLFIDEARLLTTTGILHAKSYVFSDEIKITEIIDIAKEAAKLDDPLLGFIIELEVRLLEFHSPGVDKASVRKECEDQKENIKRAVQETRKNYRSAPRITSDTKMLMESSRFTQIRKKLGITKGGKGDIKIAYCPNCGLENENTSSFCPKCGMSLSSNEQHSEEDQVASIEYFAVSPKRLILLSVATSGIYKFYWFYKNWKIIKETEKQDIRPFWRAWFSLFYCYSLFKKILKTQKDNKEYKKIHSPGWLATIYITPFVVNSILKTLSESNPSGAIILTRLIVSIVPLVPLILIQKAIANKGAKNNRNYAQGFLNDEVVVIVIGVALTVFTMVSSVMG